jgi:uncharacterized protein (DUF4415 family)
MAALTEGDAAKNSMHNSCTMYAHRMHAQCDRPHRSAGVNRGGVRWGNSRQTWILTVAEPKRTKAVERAYSELHEIVHELEKVRFEMRINFERLKFDNMPLEWGVVEVLAPVRPKKVRITAAFDEDIAKFFRSLGQGYQARMNMVLRAYVYGILSRQITSRKNEDWMGNDL